jgi:hypothetical protein
MATKTFKIGEYCKGGVITIETTAKKVVVIAKEWDTSKGFSKGSDQSNAKEWNRLEVSTTDSDARTKIDWFLFDLTTSYYADEVMKWIESKVSFKREFEW